MTATSLRFPITRHVPCLAAVALGLWLGGGCKPAAEPRAEVPLPKATVHLVTVESHGLTATEEVVGTVRAELRAAVEAKMTGRIEALLVVPGQSVKRGDTLATLDAREGQARLESAQAVRDQATRDQGRIRKLVTDGAATASELDAIQSRVRVAAAAVSEAETLLAHARVEAPFDGVITRKLADVGDLATPGRPLVEIEDPSRLRFEADVPEALLDRLQIGQKLSVRTGSPGGPVECPITEIAPVAESASRTYLVKLSLTTAPGLRAGQFGRVAVPTGDAAVAHVPATAVLQRGQLKYVFVAENNRAQLRLIRTGKRWGTDWEVVAGLNPGERIVSVDPGQLQDGQPLEVKP